MLNINILRTCNTVELLYSGHVGTSHFLHCREVVLSLDIGKFIIGALKSVSMVICIVSSIRSVLYRRFHCIQQIKWAVCIPVLPLLGSVFSVSLHPDNSLACSGGEDDRAFIWRTSDASVLMECKGQKTILHCVLVQHFSS